MFDEEESFKTGVEIPTTRAKKNKVETNKPHSQRAIQNPPLPLPRLYRLPLHKRAPSRPPHRPNRNRQQILLNLSPLLIVSLIMASRIPERLYLNILHSGESVVAVERDTGACSINP